MVHICRQKCVFYQVKEIPLFQNLAPIFVIFKYIRPRMSKREGNECCGSPGQPIPHFPWMLGGNCAPSHVPCSVQCHIHDGDVVALEGSLLAPAVPTLGVQGATSLESHGHGALTAPAYLALLTTLICCCVTLWGEMETDLTSVLQ